MKRKKLRQSCKKSCGPACLVMAARAFAVAINEKDVIKRLGGLKSFGVDTVELAELARAIGLKVVCYSLSKGGYGVRRRAPKAAILEKALARGHLVMLTIDPEILARRRPSRKLHNILLTKFASRYCRYVDPSDGGIHHIARSWLCAAWEEPAWKASAHAVVLGRLYNKRLHQTGGRDKVLPL